MTRKTAERIVQMWRAWQPGRGLTNRTFCDFYNAEIRTRADFRGVNPFEAMDVVLYAHPESSRH